jgi:hypothetical protein
MFVILLIWDSGLSKVNILVRLNILSANRISVGQLEWKRLLGKPRGRLDDNIKMDLKEIACKNVNWSSLLHFI